MFRSRNGGTKPLDKRGKVKLVDLEGKTTLLRAIRDASAFSAAIHEDAGSAAKVTFGGGDMLARCICWTGNIEEGRWV